MQIRMGGRFSIRCQPKGSSAAPLGTPSGVFHELKKRQPLLSAQRTDTENTGLPEHRNRLSRSPTGLHCPARGITIVMILILSLSCESLMSVLHGVPTTAPPSGDSDLVVPLSRLRPGQVGEVVRVLGRAEDVHRLEEFGLRHGARVEVFRQGRPCILRLGGGKVCLRADRSLKILVVPVHVAR